MLPILLAMLVTAPILTLGTWLYLRRRTLRPAVRIALLSIVFLFVLISGPALIWMWSRGGTGREIADTGSGGAKFLGQLPILWVMVVCLIGVQLYRLCRRRGEL